MRSTAQQARNLLMDLGERAHQVKFMIRVGGPNCAAAFGAVLANTGIQTVLCNVRTPRMNAIAGRWIGGADATFPTASIWNENHLRRILRAYETYYARIAASPVARIRCAAETAPRTGRS